VLLLIAAGIGYFVYQQLSGGNSVTIPGGIKGQSCAQAVQKLRSIGLAASPPCQPRSSSNADRGKVIATDPAIGSSVDKGGQVKVFVGGGVGTVLLPSLVGQTQISAQQTITGLGLPQPKVVQVNSPAQAQGFVVASDPAGGQKIPKNQVVTLQVATGNVRVPDVRGLSYDAAAAALRKRKLSPVESLQSSTSVAAGLVISTSPIAGSTPAQGTQVTVLVSSGPQQQPVPDVTQQNADDARKALTQAGFKVHTNKMVVCDQAQDKIVLSQDPGGGTSAPAGSLVTIVVGQFKPSDPSCNPPPPST
jgi:eukaryotic-like serine/threonine-protein kinase